MDPGDQETQQLYAMQISDQILAQKNDTMD